jgi:hypothetical protein
MGIKSWWNKLKERKKQKLMIPVGKTGKGTFKIVPAEDVKVIEKPLEPQGELLYIVPKEFLGQEETKKEPEKHPETKITPEKPKIPQRKIWKPEDERQLTDLVKSGKTYQEIATIMDRSPNSVRVRLYERKTKKNVYKGKVEGYD